MTQPSTDFETPAAGEPEIRQHVRRARGRFLAMASAYSLGVFNDNFLKQGISLLAITAGMSHLQGVIGALFSLPFILFAAPAGWLADRYPKRTVVILSKAMELAAMSLAAVGLLLMNWPLLLAVLFVMAAQSTIFSPALNGSIPDLYPASYVIKANAHLKSSVTCFILLGIVCAGLALNQKAPAGASLTVGHWILAGVLVAVSLAGLAVSLAAPARPAADPGARFPWSGPVDTVRQLWAMRADPLLVRAVLADAFIWFVGPLQIMVVNTLGKKQFGLDDARTSYLVLAELAGVALGGLLAGLVVRSDRWYRVLAPSALVLSGFLFATAASPLLHADHRMVYVLAMLACSGVAGGLFMVPLESFFQVRPAPAQRGAVLAAVNFAAFLGILAAGLIYIPLDILLEPSTIFAAMGVLTLAVSAWLYFAFTRRTHA